MAKFEPGKLALIIGARTENGRRFIGKTVTLEMFAPYGVVTEFKGYKFAPTNEHCWVVSGDIVSMIGVEGMSMYAQRHLMPLEDPDQFKDISNVDVYFDGQKISCISIEPIIVRNKML